MANKIKEVRVVKGYHKQTGSDQIGVFYENGRQHYYSSGGRVPGTVKNFISCASKRTECKNALDETVITYEK